MSDRCEAAVIVAALMVASAAVYWMLFGGDREKIQIELRPIFYERSVSVESSGDKAATSGGE